MKKEWKTPLVEELYINMTMISEEQELNIYVGIDISINLDS
jgi:hypothetical protein